MNIIRSRAVSALLSIVLISTPLITSAQTVSDINTQLQSISTQLQALLQQIRVLTSSSSTQPIDTTALSSTLQSIKQQVQAIVLSTRTTMPPISSFDFDRPMASSTRPSSERACAFFARNLSLGIQGTDVVNLQQILSDHGFLGSDHATGHFGPQTQAALAHFQAQFMTIASSSRGSFGPMTRNFLQQLCDKIRDRGNATSSAAWHYPQTPNWNLSTSTWPGWQGTASTTDRDRWRHASTTWKNTFDRQLANQLQELHNGIAGIVSSHMNSSASSTLQHTAELQNLQQQITSMVQSTINSSVPSSAQLTSQLQALQQQITNLVQSQVASSTFSTAQVDTRLQDLKNKVYDVVMNIVQSQSVDIDALRGVTGGQSLNPVSASQYTSQLQDLQEKIKSQIASATPGQTVDMTELNNQLQMIQQKIMSQMTSSMMSSASSIGVSMPDTAHMCKNLDFIRDLTPGSQGADVVDLQQILTDNGLLSSGNTTGFFGHQTQAALSDFQSRFGVTTSPTGSFGPLTRGFFRELCAKVSHATRIPGQSSQTCMPRPACLDTTPRCLPPEPAEGWCPTNVTPGTPPQACTMDAMKCPDGSYVGRTGPNCTFVCTGTVSSNPSPTTSLTSGITIACDALTRSLSFGSQGTDVSVLQRILTSKGLLDAGNVTGYFGPLTQSALQQFQSQNGISPAGVMDDSTLSFVQKYCSQTP